MTQNTELAMETKSLPKIARRAIALVNAELQATIREAADLVSVNQKDGWKLADDLSAFVRPQKPEKP